MKSSSQVNVEIIVFAHLVYIKIIFLPSPHARPLVVKKFTNLPKESS